MISDAHVVSYRKSGRTWLRLLIAKVLSESYGFKKIKLDTQYMTLFSKAPNVVFSHAGCTINDNKVNFKKLLRKKKIVFLSRDPRDDVVSLYNDYTKRDNVCEMDPSSFIRDEKYGVGMIVRYLNSWKAEMDKRQGDFLLVRYEDMKKDAGHELRRVLDFLKIKYTPEVIEKAVEYGSFSNMRKMEATDTFDDKRMQARDKDDISSYKTRKGKVGSHKEELSAEDILYLDEQVKAHLDPEFGY